MCGNTWRTVGTHSKLNIHVNEMTTVAESLLCAHHNTTFSWVHMKHFSASPVLCSSCPRTTAKVSTNQGQLSGHRHTWHESGREWKAPLLSQRRAMSGHSSPAVWCTGQCRSRDICCDSVDCHPLILLEEWPSPLLEDCWTDDVILSCLLSSDIYDPDM